MALANRHEGIRVEIARFLSESRRMTADAIARQSRDKQVDLGPVTPAAAAFLLSTVNVFLGREAATGVTEGHKDVRALIEWALSRLD